MAPFLIALALLAYIISGLFIALLIHRTHESAKDHYLAGRLDQQQWDRITELASVMGGSINNPIQVFIQQLDRRGIRLDLHRMDLPEWDGEDRLSVFSEI